MAEKKYEYRLKQRRKPVILQTIFGRLFNLGTKGAFTRNVDETKEGDEAYDLKVYEPGQKELKEFYSRGKQKVVLKVDLSEEKEFLAEQERLSSQHKEQVTTAESEKAEELKKLKVQLQEVQKDTNLTEQQKSAKVKILQNQIEKFS